MSAVKDLDNNRLDQLKERVAHVAPRTPMQDVEIRRMEAALEGFQCPLCGLMEYGCKCPVVTDGTAS